MKCSVRRAHQKSKHLCHCLIGSKWRAPHQNLTLMLKPAFALVSMNMTFNSFALLSPSSVDTCLSRTRQNWSRTCKLALNKPTNKLESSNHDGHLVSTRSVLFPTSTIITSPPLSVRTSSIHFEVFKKDCLSAGINISAMVPIQRRKLNKNQCLSSLIRDKELMSSPLR